jgi:phosphoglycerate dehydrogenase-like enzyme
MKNILITEFMNEDSVNLLKKNFNVNYDKTMFESEEKIKKEISNCEAIIVRNKTQLQKSILDNALNLKFVGRLGVGLDNIDKEYCKKKNIHIQTATGMNADSVAEYVIGSSLYLIKNIILFDNNTKKGFWPRSSFTSYELKDKIFGLIGFGAIGKKVCKLAQSFCAKVISYDPYINSNLKNEFNLKFTTFDEVIKTSNIISIHAPLNEETKNLINSNVFNKMSKKPILINTSRGSIVNEKDLIVAYKNKNISGFALDVFGKEPVEDNFYKQIDDTFNCILTPHISGVTQESNKKISKFIANKLITFFN